MVELFANCGDPDQTPRSAASDLGLHCLQLPVSGSPVFNGLGIRYNVCWLASIYQKSQIQVKKHVK